MAFGRFGFLEPVDAVEPVGASAGSHGGTDDFMHISTDSIDALPHLKPSTGKETTINERVAHLEAMNARLNTMLELLMGLMVEKGLLASSDISNLLKRKD
jgi:hypothetical protein